MEAWVLLVEANRDDELIFLRAWRSAGLAALVVVARDQAQALEQYQRPPHGRGAPGLILLDVDPREGHGFGLLIRLRALDPDNAVPIVAFSNSTDPEVIAEAYRLGIRAYVRKPINPDDFVEALRVLGRHWLVMNVPASGFLVRPSAPSG